MTTNDSIRPEVILVAPPEGLTEAQIEGLARAEERRTAAAAQEAPAAIEPREAAARIVETLGFEGCEDVATALRGDMVPREGAETLIAALRDRRVPGNLKVDGGPIRTAINSAWAAHNAAQNQRKEALASQPAEAVEAFREFREELREISRRQPGYATDQRIRASSARFFRAHEGLPPLVKTLEVLIVAKEGNEVNGQLRSDPQLAATVASVAEGRMAAVLLTALQDRTREAVAANGRRHNGGAFGRKDGPPASHEARDTSRQGRRDERNSHRPVGKKGK